jgi:putative endonuclease
MSLETRQKAHRKGHSAERRAAWRLRLAGFSIVAQRFKTRLGEIDIVARRGDLLVFVEVKARRDLDAAAFALQSRQFGRVSRAANLFLASHPRYAVCSVRFDAVLVAGSFWRTLWPRHLPDVWRAPE